MRVKSQHRRQATILMGGMNRRLDDRLVAEVDAVEHANRQVQRAAAGPYILK